MQNRSSFFAQARALLMLALPIVGGHLAQMALHLTDTILMGWYGVTELAALVLAGAAYYLFFVTGTGISAALMGMLAASLGRGDDRQVRRDTRMALWLSLLYGALVLIPMLLAEPILLAFGQKEELAQLAGAYLRVAGFGAMPALLVLALRSYFAAIERAAITLYVTLGAVMVNGFLAWALIFGRLGMPEMGIVGAAWATLFSQIASVLALALFAIYLPAARPHALFARFWRPDWAAFAQVTRLALPAGMTGLAESGMFIAAAMMMGWVGKVAVAAHGIAINIIALAFMVYMGISNAATVRLGRAYGERDGAAMGEIVRAALCLVLLFAAPVILAFLTIPHLLLGAFVDPASDNLPQILAFGAQLLAVAALFQLFDALQVLALGFLRAVQDAKVPMALASISYWLIGLPVSYVLAFPLGLGGIGLWLGLVIGLAFAAGLLLWRYARGGWSSVSPASASDPGPRSA